MELSPIQARLVMLGCALVIFALAMLPADMDAPTLIGLDKLKHAGAFAVLAGLAWASWPGTPRWRLVLGLTLFGLAIEAAQGVSGWGRTASLADLLADLVGLALGFALIEAMRRLRKQRSS